MPDERRCWRPTPPAAGTIDAPRTPRLPASRRRTLTRLSSEGCSRLAASSASLCLGDAKAMGAESPPPGALRRTVVEFHLRESWDSAWAAQAALGASPRALRDQKREAAHEAHQCAPVFASGGGHDLC